MFLITFLIDPPKESKLGGNLIWTKVDDIVSDAASFICSFGIDQTRIQIADGWNKFLRELFQKIDVVKADIKKIYFQDSDSSLSDFPKTNGLGFIDFLLRKLDEILKCNNSDVDTFTKYQIESIQRQLQYFQIILEPQNEPEEDIRVQIINVAYRAEHVIDYILVMDAPIWYRMVNLSGVTEQMKLIKLDIEKMEAKHMHDIRGPHDGTESRNDLPTEANFSRIDDVIVGFEDDTTTIIDQLTSGSKQLEIVSILGMPGGGKTTLAKKIFNSRVILCHFEICAWCYVSEGHSRRNSLLNILNHTAVLGDLTSELSDGQLAESLYEYLEHRRFLIVLDDIWDIEAWDELRSSFPNNDNGSRILLTSRIHNVALQANSDKLHFLRPLSDEECYKLLKMKLFQNDVCPPELSKVGQQIAKNCKGLPLAVVLIAGILAREEKHVDFWEQIAQNLSSHIASEGCMDILEPSYKHLPDVLKSYFLYFGTFQKDTVIKVKKLIRLWSADGLIQETEGKSLEDVANDYLMDLVNKSLLIVVSRRFDQRIKKCHIHDLLHCFCVTKGEEEGFFQLLNSSQLQPNGIKYQQYRLSIHTEWRSFVNSKPTGPNVRSLLFNPNNSSNGHPYAPEFFNGFWLLRVLDLEALQWGVLFPSEIFLLFHLRYLAVAGDFTSIPSSIDSLSYLETLHVRSYGSIIILPNTIFNMKRLVHVDIPTGAIVSWDDFELEKSNPLSNLVTFSLLYVSCKEDAEMLLRLLPNVRILRFQFYNQFPALDFLNKLDTLKVHKIGRAPCSSSYEFPSTLRELTLSNLGLPWKAVSAIVKLPSLEALKLLSRSFEGPCWDMKDVLRLKFLKLESLNITEWKAYNDSFPCLEQLVVKNCAMLKEIPSCFSGIPTLNIIEVHWCNSLVEESVKGILQKHQELAKRILQEHQVSGTNEIQAITPPEFRKGQHPSFQHPSFSNFIEGDIEKNPSSDDEETQAKGYSQRDDANIQDFDSSSVVDKKMASSSSYNSPCAACKCLRRKCMLGCIFAPYFPPEEPQKFAHVHKIFGASNVTKLLNELPPHQREDAVNSLVYEAEARIKDPIYGCAGYIYRLQRQVERLPKELDALLIQFKEGDIEKNPSSDNEETQAKRYSQRDDTNIQDFDSSSIADKKMASSSSYNSPCAACKLLRRKCLPGCIFAPYFPPEKPQKFACVHKIFGASNVAKLLNELPPNHREDAVNSLVYEAEARIKDPVYGCVGAITLLQRQCERLQTELGAANPKLISYDSNEVPTAVTTPHGVNQLHPVIFYKGGSREWLTK